MRRQQGGGQQELSAQTEASRSCLQERYQGSRVLLVCIGKGCCWVEGGGVDAGLRCGDGRGSLRSFSRLTSIKTGGIHVLRFFILPSHTARAK